MNASMKLLVPLALCSLVAHVATVTLEEALGQETQQEQQEQQAQVSEQQAQEQQAQSQAQVSEACLRAGFAVQVRACSSCTLPHARPLSCQTTHAPSLRLCPIPPPVPHPSACAPVQFAFACPTTHLPSYHPRPIHPLQFACRSDIDKATAFFGGSPSGESQMQAYLADAVSQRCVHVMMMRVACGLVTPSSGTVCARNLTTPRCAAVCVWVGAK
jgi:hypothetical protein